MSPEDRSLVIGGVAFLAALAVLFLGLTTIDGSDGGEVEGQFIDNESPLDPIALGDSASDGASIADPAGDGTPSAAGGTFSGAGAPTNDAVGSASTTPTTFLAPTSNPTSDDVADREATPTTRSSSGAPSTATTGAVSSTTLTTLPTTDPPSTTATTAPPTTPATTEPPAPTATTAPPPTATTTTPPTTAPAGGLDPVELEIRRLTNELRAEPSGPLARRKPMPSCVDDPFYGISIDDTTGHPNPVEAFTLSEPVSLQMSRPWAFEMNSRDELQHRPSGSQLEIYEQIGIAIAATGENIAWMSGFPDSQAARIHFEGWRESDTGHYCMLVSGAFTHLGVGHVKGSSRSWAVQNFYRER